MNTFTALFTNIHTHTHTHTLTHTLTPPQGIDVKSMGRIFIGLVKCGAWGCFDEFNRLEEAVLSAVSMQIQTIQAALRSRWAGLVACDMQHKTMYMWR